MKVDVIVVGAGPVGLSLALGLARAKKRVLVVEKRPALNEHSRAPAIWPRTQEVLAKLGVIDVFQKRALHVSKMQFWDADTDSSIFDLSLKEIESETKFSELLILPQEKTEYILYDTLKSLADIRFDAEAIDLTQDEGSVTLTFRERGKIEIATAAFVVGCDGAHSKIRELLGFSLEGMTYDFQIALADVRFKGNNDIPFPRFSTRGSLALTLKMEPDLWRLIIILQPKDKHTLDERIRMSVEQLFYVKEFELVWKSEFKIHRRMSTGFVKGRAALAGDAAHLNSPIGAQGMNAGIQDSEVLCEAILAVLDRGSFAELEDYARERRNALKTGVNRFTNQMTRVLLFRRGILIKQVLKVASQMVKFAPFRRGLLRRMTMLDTRPSATN